MTYSPSSHVGTEATKTGAYCLNMATACRLARLTLLSRLDGLIGKMSATLSSVASVSDATRRKALALARGFRWAVARYAEMNTLIRMSSALGGGRSSGVLGYCSKFTYDVKHGQAAVETKERVFRPVHFVAPSQSGRFVSVYSVGCER